MHLLYKSTFDGVLPADDKLIKCVKESKQHTEPVVPAPVPNCNGQQDEFILLVFAPFIYQ